ncbi:hypothetical protein JXA02_00730 [candidate division KSB1 bacterium]|nr:hypothetical protein [candidate division KSB1 bacterium]RQW11398.1 MAG: hypothetical protein EH222_00765 [candidate division KSB1 bacterium]
MGPTAVQDSLEVVKTFSSAKYCFSWLTMESNVIYYIAVAIGFFIIFVSYFFGGGKRNRIKILLSISTSVIIGVLTLPLLLKIAGTENPALVAFFLLLDIIFTTTVSCHMYELVVIGTHEAFDPTRMH